MNVHTLIDAFLLHRRASGCSPKTLEWHAYSLAKFAEWLGEEHKQPHVWTPLLVRSYVAHLQTATGKSGKPLSGHSITSYTSSLLAFLKWLYEEEVTPTNLALKVKKPRLPQIVKDAYSPDEIQRFLNAADNARDYAILCVLLDCGLRASELSNLTRDDVLMDQCLVVVRSGKGKKDRVVPFSFPTAKALTKYLMKRPDDSPILFPSAKGGKLLPNSVKQLITRLATRAGISGATVHRFRRTFATMYLRNGGDLITLQRLMGHSDLSTTSVYLQTTTEDLRRSHAAASPLSHLKS